MEPLTIALTALITSTVGSLVGAVVALVSNRKARHDMKPTRTSDMTN